MFLLIKVILLLLSSLLALALSARIVLDGTLGPQLELVGPAYQITADLGQQQGNNLFHSFDTFNLSSSESATFLGPNHITQIISRVTGGHSSTINGVLRSAIPNADVYLLNPAGIVFGNQAQLDIQGSFYASTADYLRLSNEGQFHATYPADSSLAIAPPTAFGFLDKPTNLEIQGSQLTVPAFTTLSLIGGDLRLTGAQLAAPSGQVNLVSLASAGEVVMAKVPSDQTIDVSSFQQQGVIQLDQSQINLDGSRGGGVSIRGSQLAMHNSSIRAKTLAEQPGKNLDLILTTHVQIRGALATLSNSTLGKGHAGSITIITPYLEINGSNIETSSLGEGHAGGINIKTDKIVMKDGSNIYSDSFKQGSGGYLNIVATEGIFVSDQRRFFQLDQADFSTGISSASVGQGQGGRINLRTNQLVLNGGTITSNSHREGQAGQIVIQADSIDMTEGALISATALSQATGKGGSIDIQVNGTLHMSGFRPGWTITSTDNFENLPTAISAVTIGDGLAGSISLAAQKVIVADQATIATATGALGAAGNIVLEAEQVYLTSGGFITNSSGGRIGERLFLGTGPSGTIKITVADTLEATGQSERNPSGIFSNTIVAGPGGNIIVQANHIKLTNGAAILTNSLGQDNAGTITVQANTITLSHAGNISSSAQHASGGQITLVTPNLLYLQEGKITTSVGNGKGNGGNITIENPVLVVLDQAQLVAQADAGQGGNILINADHVVFSHNSLVSGSSKQGIDGHVLISSPKIEVSGRLVILTTELLKADTKLKKSCINQVYDSKKQNRFLVTNLTGSPPSPHDWQGSHLLTDLPQQPIPASQTVLKSKKISNLTMNCEKPTTLLTEQPSVVIPEQLF